MPISSPIGPTSNPSRLLLGAAVFALTASTACNYQDIAEGGGGARINQIDASLDGQIRNEEMDGSVDRAYGDYSSYHVYASVEAQKTSRGVMTYFNIFNNAVTVDEDSGLGLENGVIYGSSTDGDTIIISDEGDQFFRTDGETNIEDVPEDLTVDVGECEGINIDIYDDDQPVDNVVFQMEDCTTCDDQETNPRNVRYMAWNGNAVQDAVYATFTLRKFEGIDEDYAQMIDEEDFE